MKKKLTRNFKRLFSVCLIFSVILSGVGNYLFLNSFTAHAKEKGEVIAPLAKYEFLDSENPGKDTMGNYNLEVKVSDGHTTGNVSIKNGVAIFDGTAGLTTSSDENDIGEDLQSFTVAYEIKAPTTPAAGWSTPVGFGWNGFAPTKFGTFHIAPGDATSALRFSTHANEPENYGPYWGWEISKLSTETYSTVILSAKVGGKMTVYVDGVSKYSCDLPSDFSLKDPNMRFALGGMGMFGNIYNPFSGSLADVRVYGFAFDESQVTQYMNKEDVYGDKQSDTGNLGEVINPLAKYEFKDETNPGKDTMGNYDLVTTFLPGATTGNLTIKNGAATFDGTAALIADSEDNDISEELESFTVAFEIMGSETASADWATPIGFGWNDWGATKWGNFHIAPSDTTSTLRFTTHADGTSDPYWGTEIGMLYARKYKTIILSAQLGEKMTVYMDGEQIVSWDLPTTYSLHDSNMRFALGGSSTWGNIYQTFIGSLKNVRVYDFAFDESQVNQYLKENNIYGEKEPEVLGQVISPLAKYEFKDAKHPGKDTMGNYDLVAKYLPDAKTGNIKIDNGVATFDGTAALVATSNDSDISECLESFTIAFDILGAETPLAAWSTPIGFGWNTWYATKFANFHIAPNETTLRFSTHANAPENCYQYWGWEIGTLSTDSYRTIVISARPGGKMTIYLNGVEKYSCNIPADFSLKDPDMRFALGGSSTWGNVYEPFIGSLANVQIYDFAFDELQAKQYTDKKNVYKETDVYVVKSVTDFTKSIQVPIEASDAEILAYAPAVSYVNVTMSDKTVREVSVRWTSVEVVDGEKCLAGKITTLSNPNGVKAYAKVKFIKNTKVLLPIALYEFQDTTNPGKDSMGNYNLKVAYAEKYNSSNGGVKVSNGVASFNGTAGLVSGTEANDLSESLESFTMTYTIKTDGSYPSGWAVPIGFGWDDWEPKGKWFLFQLADGSSDLRFTMSSAKDKNTGFSDVDGNANQWWGPVVGTVSNEKTVTVTVQQGGNIVVYVDGVAVKTYKTPAGFSMSDSAMQFAIGCCGSWGDVLNPFVGEISNVAVYGTALTEEQVKILSVAHEIRTNLASEAYITKVSSKPTFKGGATSSTLVSSMTVKEMLAKLNKATVKAGLSDGTSKTLDVVWTGVQKRGDVYRAIGYANTANAGILSVVGTVPITYTLRVHTFNEITYEWSEDYSTCTATHVSKLDSSFIETETVNTIAETIEPTCTEDGKTIYTAVFTNRAFDTQTMEVAGAPTPGHAYNAATYEWSEDYSTCTATIVCSTDESHVVTETVYSTIAVVKDAKEGEHSVKYEATFTNDLFETQTYTRPFEGIFEETSYFGVILGSVAGILVLAAGVFIIIKRKNSKGVEKS